jgi:hypothetical protein
MFWSGGGLFQQRVTVVFGDEDKRKRADTAAGGPWFSGMRTTGSELFQQRVTVVWYSGMRRSGSGLIQQRAVRGFRG